MNSRQDHRLLAWRAKEGVKEQRLGWLGLEHKVKYLEDQKAQRIEEKEKGG